MSEMLERAAKAVFESSPTMKDAGWAKADATARKYARAALLAALDPEDEALIGAVAEAIEDAAPHVEWVGSRTYGIEARAAIAALKALAQGETNG